MRRTGVRSTLPGTPPDGLRLAASIAPSLGRARMARDPGATPAAPAPDLAAPAPDLAASAPGAIAEPPTPRVPADRSTWERLVISPDVELHVRRPLDRATNRRVDQLERIARELFDGP
jgi:hypothetical protein